MFTHIQTQQTSPIRFQKVIPKIKGRHRLHISIQCDVDETLQ